MGIVPFNPQCHEDVKKWDLSQIVGENNLAKSSNSFLAPENIIYRGQGCFPKSEDSICVMGQMRSPGLALLSGNPWKLLLWWQLMSLSTLLFLFKINHASISTDVKRKWPSII